jgi:large subunit ribosomal protein L3
VNLGLLGKKIGMTQIFDEKGRVIPVTIVEAGPCIITELKKCQIFGYNSITLGYNIISKNINKIKKSIKGYFLKKELPILKYLKEYKISNLKDKSYEIGDKFTLSIFNKNEKVNITSKSIGKGNSGNIKKNNFKRGAMSHGSKNHRLQGSLGAGTSPGRVFPGKKMPGRLGGKKVTIKNLEIIDLYSDKNLLLIKGSIPGKAGSLINIQKRFAI